MKKHVLSLFSIALICSSAVLQAQTVTFGPMLGSNLSWANVNDNAIHITPTASYTAGAFARVKILKFYVQPEVMYAQKGVNFKTINSSTGQELVQKLRYNAVDVNLMLGLQLFKLFDDTFGMRIHTGPGMSNYMSNSFRIDGKTIDEQSAQFNANSFNWQAGIGFDVLNRFFVDFRYGIGFSDIVDNGPYKIIPRQASVLLAYKLIKDK
jgi:hypothetical protein